MPDRPKNHVTRAMAERTAFATKPGSPPPPIPPDLLHWLEAAYPPRCLGTRENVEDHLRYAGQVELVASLRAHYDAGDEDDESLRALMQDGERAS